MNEPFRPSRPPLVARRLRECVDRALDEQPRHVARAMAASARAGGLRIVGVILSDPDTGEPIGETLTYLVHIRLAPVGWVELCAVDWRELGLDVADVQAAVERHKRAHGAGGEVDPAT